MKFKLFRILTIILSFFFFTGFVPILSFVGPGVTALTSGNIYKASAQFIVNQRIEKETGKNSIQYISSLMKEDIKPKTEPEVKINKEFIKLVKNQILNTRKKIPEETIKLLKIQKDMMIKQLIKFPSLYYAKSSFPLEISQRAFNHLWRMCESYELWCKETKQTNHLFLKITN